MTAEMAGAPPGVSLLTGDGRLPADVTLAAFAADHRIELLLYSRLLQEDRIPTRVRAMAIGALEEAGEQNRQYLGELQHLTLRLAEAGIRVMPLKGPVLAQFLWDDPALRRCRDIDVLLPAEEIARALPILEAADYRPVSPLGSLLRQVELWNERKRLTLDLHWNITHREMPFHLDFDRLWDERQEITCDGVTFTIASPEWLFIFSSFYLVKSHPWLELLYLSDLARLVDRAPSMDWGRVDEIARRTGTRRICCVALALVEALTGCVPAQARAHFPADRTVHALVRRLGRAAARPALLDDLANPGAAALRRLRRLLAHARFRERPTDKARVGVGLLLLCFGAGGDIPGGSDAPRRFQRLARVGGVAAARAGRSLLQAASPWISAARPADGTRFYPLDDAGVVLSVRQQALFALSPSAAFVWRALQDGTSLRKTVRQLAALSGQPVAGVSAQVAVALHQWRLHGLLDGSNSPDGAGDGGPSAPKAPVYEELPPPRAIRAPIRPLPRQCYRQLDTVFEIELPNDALATAVHSAIGHLATTDAPQIAVRVEPCPAGYVVEVNGRTEDCCPTADSVVPALKAILATTAINRSDFGLYIHGAMLHDGGSALLLPAPPQSGKTCLAAALARRGLTFCTDEATLLDRHCFAARGLPAALAVKAAAWDLLQPLYPELRVLPAHRRADGKVVKYLPPPVGADPIGRERPCRVRTIVFPRYERNGSNTLVPLARPEALRLLMEECVAMRLALEEDEVQGLIDWLGPSPAMRSPTTICR